MLVSLSLKQACWMHRKLPLMLQGVLPNGTCLVKMHSVRLGRSELTKLSSSTLIRCWSLWSPEANMLSAWQLLLTIQNAQEKMSGCTV